jgi:acetyl-CoA carboxylase biotin carboxylase subunit
MGDKVAAKEVAASSGVQTVPGSEAITGVRDAIDLAKAIGFPLLVKARSGGGGRGIKKVESIAALQDVFDIAAAEARASFGDGSLYLERYLTSARHIEVQVLGDRSGNVIHLGDRDCSVQRRYQKVIEEAPASSVPPSTRQAMFSAALAISQSIGYDSVGTVEFAYDQEAGEFYFLEMNTRIQVEHPVTEMLTGVDLVREQIEVAAGRVLGLMQGDVRLSGHSIECRITAEAPDRGFAPSPGRIEEWKTPQGNGVRVDTHCYSGYLPPPYYDSLLAKVIVHGPDRTSAIDRMLAALRTFTIAGIASSLAFLAAVVDDDDFRANRLSTRWLEETKLVAMQVDRPSAVSRSWHG